MNEDWGKRLQAARKGAGFKTQQSLGDVVGVGARMVRYWEARTTPPDPGVRAQLHKILGPFDDEGDPVEVAIRRSELTKDRQHEVIGHYMRCLREQREAQAS